MTLLISSLSYAGSSWTCFKDGKEVFKSNENETTYFDGLHFSKVKLVESKSNANILTGYFKQGHDEFDYVVTFRSDRTVLIQKSFFMDGYGNNEEEEILACKVK